MRTSGIGTRYAFYVAALSLALVAVTLAASGAIALGRMRVLQQELRDAVTTARARERHYRTPIPEPGRVI